MIFQINIYQAIIRRIVEHLTFRQLPAYHIFIVIGNHLMNNRVVDTLGLEYHTSAFILTPGASRYLCH